MQDTDKAHDQKDQGQNNKVEVSVATTSGFYPDNGFNSVPVNQKVEVELKKAAKKLKLTDTSNWVASVSKNPIDPDKSYAENGLSGQIEIDWGPREGGGGV